MSTPIIPYARQSVSEQDIQSVVDVLRSDWLTQGPAVDLFERTVADYCGATYAVAVNSATSALHIAGLAAGLGPGDTAWTSPNTFVASANCALYCGSQIDFVDIDPRTYNLSAAALENKLDHARQTGKLPKVIIPVHFAGRSCDMEQIAELARRYRITLIEDAAHAVGGRYSNRKIGSCEFSDMTVLSFHPVKIITTGEGGMVLTNKKDLYDKLIRLRSHGITRDPALMVGPSDGAWYYQQIELGYNYRMTDIQAALGTSQMKSIDEFVTRRRTLADQYDAAFVSMPIGIPERDRSSLSAWHLYVIQVDEVRSGISRKVMFDALRSAGILANVHYIPVHLQPYYRTLGFKPGDFPAAERYYNQAISLPLYPGLSDEAQLRIIDTIGSILEGRQ